MRIRSLLRKTPKRIGQQLNHMLNTKVAFDDNTFAIPPYLTQYGGIAQRSRWQFCYLSQQAEPSPGWAQHAPPLSSGISLGVQQTDALLLGVQQEVAAAVALFLLTLLFPSTGISVCVSISVICFHL